MTRSHRKMPAAIPNTRDGKRTDREMKKVGNYLDFSHFSFTFANVKCHNFFHKRFKYLVGAAVRPQREAQSTHELVYMVLHTLI